MEQYSLIREYDSWEVIRQRIPDDLILQPGDRIYVSGDLNGDLTPCSQTGVWSGFFEHPGKGEEKGFYEVNLVRAGDTRVISRTTVRYCFDSLYFSPKWENIDLIGDFLVEKYAGVEKEILYSYQQFSRNIQLLKITDPAVPLHAKQVIFLTGRIHNAENGTTLSLLRFIKWLLDGEGKQYLSDYLFLIIPMTIPLNMEHEDPRSHDVNREWRIDMTEPDLLAVRDKVLDRYLPEIWIDSHNFNDILDLTKENALRMACGDYVVAHPVGEEYFDWNYSRDIARRMIQAAEKEGHQHRGEAFFVDWAEKLVERGLAPADEEIRTEHDGCGIFSGRDYARYADRIKYGPPGRSFPAMAGDYGYERCHAVNIITETKPASATRKVMDSDTSIMCYEEAHYPPEYQNSNLLKLQEICRIGREFFTGQAQAGFPCNLLIADSDRTDRSAILTAWGCNYQERRVSRQILWTNRKSIVLKTIRKDNHNSGLEVTVYSTRAISCNAALRIKMSEQAAEPIVNGIKSIYHCVKDGYVFVPIFVRQGTQKFQIDF